MPDDKSKTRPYDAHGLNVIEPYEPQHSRDVKVPDTTDERLDGCPDDKFLDRLGQIAAEIDSAVGSGVAAIEQG